MGLWVKVCGITSVADAQLAVDAGADAIGLNLWPHSPRHVDVPAASRIAAAIRGRVEVVLVSVDLPMDAVREARAQVGADWVQLHGRESDAEVQALGPRAYRAIGLGDAADVQRALAVPGPWVLVDAKDAVRRGGTGRTADAFLAAAVCQARRTILAGGLTADNVAAAVRDVRPAGVDAASGLERAIGIKDGTKVHAFVQAARRSAQDCAQHIAAVAALNHGTPKGGHHV